MTRLSTGDRGQRYEVRATGWPKRDEESVVGWTNDIHGADEMAEAASLAPGCTKTLIFDRDDQKLIQEWEID